MPYPAVVLGVAGLIPFIGLPLLAVTGVLGIFEAMHYFTLYSAVLLSFFGGVHWYDAIANRNTGHQLYVAMLPTIVGWLCLILGSDVRTLGVLSIAYLAILIYDKFTLALPRDLIMSYTTLRIGLTTVVVLSHALMIYLIK
ncbi:DUF3429 domain-containing protein [Salinimonas sp. HHU 13199]|uniref:DUF3429 domain-containing protein n=1 Tax=Salinimonas profundi TaxID=2729140 RepID=A0ABR8LJW9_9ALTE|nr:DUF3429 domain-containing protein [Salinimonas profundi]MBD3584592.1 DUF3429 domain-containing protein [Salinimonas profundi]